MHVRRRTSSVRQVFTIDVVTLVLYTAYNIYIICTVNSYSIVKQAPFYQYFFYLLAAGIAVYLGISWLLIYSPDSQPLWWLKYGIIF